MTMMVLEGSEYERQYEATGALPDPARGESDDEKALLNVFRREIPLHPNRFRTW
jgi:adenosylhomocysteinase